MKKRAKAYVVLAGGLGNQLFQVSALLSLDSHYEKLWLKGVCKPRLNSDGSPESFTLLKLPSRVAPILFQGLLQKIVNLNLKQSIPDVEGIKATLFTKIKKKFSELVFSIILFEKINIANLVDEISLIQKKAGSIVLIGYFQTSIYAQTVKNLVRLNEEKILHERVDLIDLHRDSINSSPLIIHVRRGDYQLDRNFGLLSDIYYRSALKEISIKLNPIWVFSDDIEYARIMLHEIASRVARWIADVDHSSSMSLFAMSFGSTYIIANSTFSWWGAYLSRGSPLVYYPESWLRGIPHRGDLFPNNWMPIEANYE